MARLLKRDETLIQEAQRRFDEAKQSWSKCRDEAREDFRFEAGDQWDQAVLKSRIGRPSLTVNKLYSVVQQIVGDQRQNRPAIKVKPVDSQSDPELAEALTGLCRSIQNNSDAEAAYDTAFQHAVTGGFGYFRINTVYADDEVFEQEIRIERILDPFSVYVDPMAQRADKSDAKWLLVTDVMSRDAFNAAYPKHEVSDFDTESRPSWYPSDSVVVAEYWYKVPATRQLWMLETGEVVDGSEIGEDAVAEYAGKRYLQGRPDETGMPQLIAITKERTASYDKVKWAKLCGHGVIEKRDWVGKYFPIVGVYGQETIVDGELIYRSAIRYARDAQRTYNWMRSTAVETIAQAPRQPFLATPKQIENHESQWQQMHDRPMPYLLYNATNEPPPQRLGGTIPDIGAAQEAQISADDIKGTTGIYDASLGAKSNETSGKAIMARQREGDTATFSFIDNLSRAIRLAGRIIVDLIPKIYDTERTVRILGEDDKEEFIALNKVVVDPSEPQGFRVINDITKGKYDVVVSVGPSYNSKRVESAEAMLGFVQAVPQAGGVILDLVARNMDWPGADEIADRLQKMLPPGMAEQEEDPQAQQAMMAQQRQAMQQQEQMMQQQQMAQQAEMQKAMIEIQTAQAKLEGVQLDNAKKEVELRQAAMPQPVMQGDRP